MEKQTVGNTWVVNAWTKFPQGYGMQEVYRGESLISAVRAMRRAHRAGHGYVALEWRPVSAGEKP
jgi:hypothetical protein